MASLDFSTVGEEVSYYLSHVARGFMGGYSGSGENGVDISMPRGTPVYAVTGGSVVGSGYYGGGGVVSIQEKPGKVWYYQHTDENLVKPGQNIKPGQLIAYSGGQNSGGKHPATPEFSSFEHIEIGINAPWGGIWGGGQGANINPVPDLSAAGSQNGPVPTSGSSGQSTSTTSATAGSGQGTTFSWTDASTWAPAIISGALAPLGITSIQDLLWRLLFIGVGIGMMFIAFMMLVVPQEAGAAEKIIPLAAGA